MRTRPVHDEMSHIGQDVYVDASSEVAMILETTTENRLRASVDDVDSGLHISVKMGLGPRTVAQNQNCHTDSPRSDRLTSEPAQIGQALFALVGLSRPNYATGGGSRFDRPLSLAIVPPELPRYVIRGSLQLHDGCRGRLVGAVGLE